MRLSAWLSTLLVICFAFIGCGTSTRPSDECPSNTPTLCDPTENTVRLTVVVNGGDEVQFYDNQNGLHRCGTLAPSQDSVPSCTAEFVRGSQVRIQRTLAGYGNPRNSNEDAIWRLYLWGGACLGLDANIEPRGGICVLTMDGDKNVIVGFERRAKLRIQQVLLDQPMSIRWGLAYSPQKAGGNPSTRAGEFDCSTPNFLPACTLDNMYYDVGTVITVTAGSSVVSGTPAFWKNWGQGCASAGQNRVCTVTLTGDLLVTGSWGF